MKILVRATSYILLFQKTPEGLLQLYDTGELSPEQFISESGGSVDFVGKEPVHEDIRAVRVNEWNPSDGQWLGYFDVVSDDNDFFIGRKRPMFVSSEREIIVRLSSSLSNSTCW